MSSLTTATERPRAAPIPEARPVESSHRRSIPCLTDAVKRGTRTGWAMRSTYFVCDLAAIAVALAMAEFVVAAVGRRALPEFQSLDTKLLGLLGIGLLFAAALQKTYAAIPPRPVRQFRGWVLGAATVCASLAATTALVGVASLAQCAALVIATLLAIVLASFGRAVCRIACGRAPWWGTRLIVVGSGGVAARAFADLKREPQWGLCPVGFVDDALTPDSPMETGHYLGPLGDLDNLAAELGVDRALVTAHAFDSDELAEVVSGKSSRIRHWIVMPPLARFPSLWLEECEAARRPAVAITNRLALPWSQALKRSLDVVVTLSLGVIVAPLVAAIALLVKLTSSGPAFYCQERIGCHGRRFTAWKFRTMFRDADAVLARYLERRPELAAQWQAKHKLLHDPRVTWIGHWLRVTSLDELPQMWNVLRGDMSLVGPRPIVAAEIPKYADRFEQYAKVLPGITGLWQVSGRNNTTYKERVDLDTYYVQNWSIWLDIYILACTVKVVLLGEGAY